MQNKIKYFPFQKRTLANLLDHPRKGKRLIEDIFNIEVDTMATVNEANEIREYFNRCAFSLWDQKNTMERVKQIVDNTEHKERIARATLVIQWVQGHRGNPMKDENGKYTRPVLVKPEYLAAAMTKQKFWCQGPSDYLDMFDALQAVFELIPEQKELPL